MNTLQSQTQINILYLTLLNGYVLVFSPELSIQDVLFKKSFLAPSKTIDCKKFGANFVQYSWSQLFRSCFQYFNWNRQSITINRCIFLWDILQRTRAWRSLRYTYMNTTWNEKSSHGSANAHEPTFHPTSPILFLFRQAYRV